MGTPFLPSGGIIANRFEVQGTAGVGGMGTVYRARDCYSGDLVAVKLLHDGGSLDGEERFVREARLLSELRHPGIVSYVAHGLTPDGHRYLVMEWLDGQDLSARLRAGPLSLRDTLLAMDQIADALSIAHNRGIIHRDLKPSNLFLCGNDLTRVKILDFGIARRLAEAHSMTRTGMVVGTPEYMAPEQARGHSNLTTAVDMFSLGCILYECLTGQPPFVAAHVAAVLARILFEEPGPIEERRVGLPTELSTLVSRLLAKDPTQRLTDAEVLRTELRKLSDSPEPAKAATLFMPRPQADSFAEKEQSLFSIVLAAPSQADTGAEQTLTKGDHLLVQAKRKALLHAVLALGVTAEFLATGTLIATVSPQGSAQDQATRAARAALLIKERWPESQVAMATGRGVFHGRTAVGEVVDVAARSLKTAHGSDAHKRTSGVYIDPLSAKLLEGRFVLNSQPGGALLLHENREVDSSRLLLGKPTPCVGREAELNNLEGQLAACMEESEARVVLITAPPGVGKTRLRHEFLRRIEKRSVAATILLGRGDMMSAGAPYGVLRAAICRLCEISSSDALDIQRQRLQARVGQHIATAELERVVLFVGELCNIPFSDEGRPKLQAARQDPKIMRDWVRRAFLDLLAAECAAATTLLILDDLQWADELTVSILDEALRELAEARLFVLSFSRPEVLEVYPQLWTVHKVQAIPLKGLSNKACERLMIQVLGKDVSAKIIASVVEQCGGNALFLEELIRSYAEGNAEAQPDTVVAMLQARIGRLDSNVRRAVRAAAVFGQTFWRRGVAALLGMPPDAPEVQDWLSALVAAELIQPSSQSRLAKQSEYGFRHALVRDAAYGLLADSDLVRGHRLAGHFLEQAGHPNAAFVADHLERGRELPRAAAFYLKAAEACLEQFDLTGVIRHVDRGVRCGPEESVLGKLRCLECFAALLLHQHERLARVCEEAIALVRPGSLEWCRVAPAAYLVAMLRQDGSRAAELLGLLLSTEPDANAQVVYLLGLILLFAMLSVAAPVPLLDTLLQRISDCVERWTPTSPALFRHLHAVRVQMVAFRQPKPWTLVTEAERAIKLSREVGDNLIELALNTHLIVWGWLELGAREKMEAHLKAYEALILQGPNRAFEGHFRHVLARVLADSTDEHRWAEAEKVVTPLLSMDNGPTLLRSCADGILARVALQRGQLESAEARARTALVALSSGPAWFLPIGSVQIRALIGLGRASEATQVAEQLLSLFPILGGGGVFEVEFRVAVSEAFHSANDRERAHAELSETLHQIRLRAADITDPFWKNSYLTRNPFCVRAQQLGTDWGLDLAVF